MITKERLEVLLEEDKVFYWVFNKEISMLHKLSMPSFWKRKWEFYSKDCFETKEDAEEHAEFSNITRTERLELPSWEEFNKVSTFAFKRKDGTDMEIAIWHNCPDDDCKTIKITRSYDWSACCFEKPLTRENYNEARRFCVKLFKGEEV